MSATLAPPRELSDDEVFGKAAPAEMSDADVFGSAPPPATAFARARQAMADDPEAGSLLPLAGDAEKGTLRVAVPNIMRSIGRGIVDLLEGPTTGTVTPEASSALLLGLGTPLARNIVPPRPTLAPQLPPPPAPAPSPRLSGPPPGPQTPPGVPIPEGLFSPPTTTGGAAPRPTLAPDYGPGTGGVAQRPPATAPQTQTAPGRPQAPAVTTTISLLDAVIANTPPGRLPTLAPGSPPPPSAGIPIPEGLFGVRVPTAPRPAPTIPPLAVPPGQTATPPTADPTTDTGPAPPAALAPPVTGAAAPPAPAAPPTLAPSAQGPAAAVPGEGMGGLPTTPEIAGSMADLRDLLADPRTAAEIQAAAAVPPADPPLIPQPSPADPPPRPPILTPLSPDDIAAAASQTVEPTPAQAQAGNYRQGKVNIGGIEIAIETPAGGTRSGVGTDGRPWSTQMPVDYGRIARTTGADGDQLDVYLGPSAHDAPNHTVFIIDQKDPTTHAFDEHKAMLGFPTQEAAIQAYNAAFDGEGGRRRIGAITPMSFQAFKVWSRSGSLKRSLRYKAPKPPKAGRKMRSLLQFLAARGGLSPNGDLTAMDAHRKFIPGSGALVRKRGLDLDRARELAEEAGYLGQTPGDYSQSTTRDLLDAIDEELRGRPVYSSHEAGDAYVAEQEYKQDADDDRRAAAAEELEAIAEDLVILGLTQAEIDAAMRLITEDGLTPYDAMVEVIHAASSEELADGLAEVADANYVPPFDLEPTPNGLLPVPAADRGEGPAPTVDAQGGVGRQAAEPPAPGIAQRGDNQGEPRAQDRADGADEGLPGDGRPDRGPAEPGPAGEGVAPPTPPQTERVDTLDGAKDQGLLGGIAPIPGVRGRPAPPAPPSQQAPGGMFGSEAQQTDLVDATRAQDKAKYGTIAQPNVAGMAEGFRDAIAAGRKISSIAQARRFAAESMLHGAVLPGSRAATAVDEALALARGENANVDTPPPAARAQPVKPAQQEDNSRDNVRGPSPADAGAAQPEAPTGDARGGQPVDVPAGSVGAGGGSVQRDIGGDGEAAPADGADVRGASPIEGAGDLGSGPDGVRDADRPAGETDAPVASAGPKNYVITDEDGIGKGGLVSKARNNLAAIRVMKQIEEDGRSATTDEQQVLAQYVGWGGIKGVFEPRPRQEWAQFAAELRALLNDDEWKSAAGSTLNAHYTSPEVVKGVWAAVQHMGFKGGRILEPSAGVGNFIGMAPQGMPNKMRWSAGELDNVTGRILRLIYPEAAVNIGGFENARLPKDFYDLAISNVPFGEYGVHDPRPEYAKARRFIHDYFFARALDHVRPGGVVAFITSKGTLDKLDASTRKMLAGKAAFLGAVRLPDTAFKSNANTEVTTDVVFLRRLGPDEAPDMTAPWLGLGDVDPRDGASISINQYFVDHPEMMLGTMQRTGSMYRAAEPTLEAHAGQDIGDALRAAVQNLPTDGYRPPPPRSAPTAAAPLEAAMGEREGSFGKNAEGIVYQVVDGQRSPVAGKRGDRARSYIVLRDAAIELAKVEIAEAPDADVAKARTTLNKAYDAFVAQHGAINQSTRRRSSKGGTYRVMTIHSDLKKDPDFARIAALEDYDEAVNKGSKRAIFRERIIGRANRATTAASPADAVALSIDRFGRFDLPFAAEALGMTEREAIKAFDDLIFRNPDGEAWETSVEYLSGDVRGKLKRAEAAAALEPSYHRNVGALAARVPADLMAHPDPLLNEIAAPFGGNWIPEQIYRDFLDYVAQRPVEAKGTKVRWSRKAAAWAVVFGADGYSHPGLARFTTDRVPFSELFRQTINNQPITIRDRVDGDPPTMVVNKDQTDKARAMQTSLREEFANWIYSDPDRTAAIARLYNDKYNNLAPRDWNAFANALTLPGIATQVVRNNEMVPFQLRPHQVGAVSRIVASGNTLLGHAVGAGKTITMIAAGMEMKRLGLVRKPVYVVPNHMLGQFTREFYELYPNANVTVARKEDMSKNGRQAFVGRIAAENADAIIMTHSSFGRLSMRPGAYADYIQEELDAVQAALEEMIAEEGKSGATVRLIQKRRKALEARLLKLQSQERKDTGATFEETGIDFVFVDEAHEFKNLPISTKMGNVRGLSTSASGKAVDLMVKMRHLDKMNPGRAGVFATGTPVSNTMAEVYTMQRYLQPRMLEEQGIESFDGWASTFGEIVTSLEVKPSGEGFKEAKRFSKFLNAPELTAMFSTVSDVQTSEMLNLPRPALKGGKPTIIEMEATAHQSRIAADLTFRYEHMPKDPREDNVLKVVSEGRKAALDPRLLDDDADADSGLKLSRAATEIATRWKSGNDHPTAKLQIVFCDLGTPGGKAKAAAKVDDRLAADDDPYILPVSDELDEDDEDAAPVDAEQKAAEAAETEAAALSRDTGFNVYDDLTKRLVAAGIPREQIAYIHDAKTDAQKEELFAAARSGKIRVLMGSTAKMGVGTNVQMLATAMHHLDAPWRPSDVEQRDGRILRQGNRNAEIEILRYVTKGTFDAYMWQTLEAKAKFIGQFLAGSKGKRTVEDIDTPLPDAATMKAIATGDMRILEKAELEREINILRAVRENHARVRQQAASLARQAPADIASYKQRIAEDRAALEQVKGAKWAGVKRQNFPAMKEAAEAIEKQWAGLVRDAIKQVGSEFGTATVELTLPLTFAGHKVQVTLEAKREQQITRGLVHSWGFATLDQFRVVIDGQKWVANSPRVGALLDPETLAFQEGEPTFTPEAVMRRIAGMFQSLPERIASYEKRIENTKSDAIKALETAAKAFPREDEYNEKRARLAALDAAFRAESGEGPKASAARDSEPTQRMPSAEAIAAVAEAVRAITGGQVKISVLDVAMTVAGQRVDGMALGPLILAAMQPGVASTLHHEAVHALRNLGVIGAGEWAVLRAAAERGGWLKQFDILSRYRHLANEAQIEEAIASKFGEWATGSAPRPKGPVGRAWNRVERFFERAGNALRGRGFQTADDVFERIQSGKIGQRAPGSQGPRRGPQTPDDAIALMGFFDTFADTPNTLAAVLKEARFALGPQGRMSTAQPVTFASPAESRKDNVLYALQDKHIDTKRVLEAIQASGRRVADDADPRLREELYHNRVSKRLDDFAKHEVRSLLEAMVARKVSIAQLEKFLWERHAEERNTQVASINPGLQDNGSGMMTADARAALDAYTVDERRDLDILGAYVDGIATGTRALWIKYELEDQAYVRKLTDTYQHYVPLQREEMEDPLAGAGTGQGFSTKGSASKRALGSERPVVNILANLFAQREQAVVRGEKNIVANALHQLARDNPNPDFWTLDEAPMIRHLDPNTGLVRMIVDPGFKARPDVVVARALDNRGRVREHALMFNRRDPRALRMAMAIKNLDMDELNQVIGKLAIATRLIAQLNTQYNPIFGVVNLVRDSGEGSINLLSTPIPTSQAKVLRNVPLALGAIMRSLRRDRAQKPRIAGKWSDLWEEFQSVGGPTGFRDIFRTAQDRGKALQREMARLSEGRGKRAAMAPFRWARDMLSDFNEAMENAVRLSAYSAAKDAGLTRARSASLAKNLTVNFNRKGAWTNQIGAFYAFFNASVQGTTRMIETLSTPKVGVSIVAGGVLLGMLQQFALVGAGFADKEIPDFILENNLVIPIGGKEYLKVPLPLGFKMLPGIGRVSTALALSGGEDAGKKLLNLVGSVASSFNPLGSVGWSTQTFTPTVFDPIAAVIEDRRWSGPRISIPNRSDLDKTPGFSRATASATGVSTGIAFYLNQWSGGTNWTPGGISPTPDQIDYLTAQYAGGAAREMMNLGKTLGAVGSGDPVDPARIPLAGRFYGTAKASQAIQAVYYKNIQNFNDHRRTVKGLSATGGNVAAYVASRPEAALTADAAKSQRAIGDMRRDLRALKSQGAPKERIQAVEGYIIKEMEGFNALVEKFKKETPRR